MMKMIEKLQDRLSMMHLILTSIHGKRYLKKEEIYAKVRIFYNVYRTIGEKQTQKTFLR